jgi:threonine/homoserine/homoserine lactone efflux protein
MFAFLSEVVVISLSGVMAPGPVTAAALGKGSRTPHAGALIAIGHGLVEVPVMVAVLYGVRGLVEVPYVRLGVSVLGALFLIVMAIGMLRSLRDPEIGPMRSVGSPLTAGVLLTLGNPYFFVWWATIGATLVLRSVVFGIWGFVALAASHWLCDFVWDYFLSALSFKGGQFFGKRFQKAVFLVCGCLLVVFAVKLLVDAAWTALA